MRSRWAIFSAMAGVYYAFGVMVMSIPPMVSTVRADLGISRAAMGLALGAWALIYIVSAPPAGRLIDRIGIERSILLGAGFIAASGFARAAAQGLGTLWLAIAIFGVGGPLVSASAPKLIAVLFTEPAERRLAVGLYSASPALGGVTALVLTNGVLLPLLGSWRLVVVVYSFVAVLAALCWRVVSRAAPTMAAPVHHRGIRPSASRALLRSPGVRLALVLGLGSFFVNHGLSGWLPNVLEEDSDLSATAASLWVALSTVVGIGASLVLPSYSTAERRVRVLHGVMAVMGASMLVITVAPTGLDVAAVLTLGVRAALVPLVILGLMEAEGVTPTNMGVANGLWFSVAEVGGATGPLVVGAVGDSSAGFAGSLVLMTGVVMVLALAVGLDEARRRRFGPLPAVQVTGQR